VPTYHGDGRADWTFAVVITYRDTATMTGPSNDAEIVKRLYPDAATFARDAKILIEGGYKLDGVTPVDQFRYSYHVEIVAKFAK